MIPKFQAILFSAALWVPLACPAMAMEHPLEGGMHERASIQMSVAGHGNSGGSSPVPMDLDAPVAECCLSSTGHGMDHERGSGIVPQAGTYDAVPAFSVCERFDPADRTESVSHDAAVPPPTFEQRSVMRRE